MFAEAIGRKVQTVRGYVRDGIVPEALFFDKRGWRLYSAQQCTLAKTVFAKFDRGDLRSLQEVGRVLKKYWRTTDVQKK
jgi:hypothetical protein